MPGHADLAAGVAGFVGLRVGELLGLERRHVNLLHGTITIDQQEHQLANGMLLVAPPKTAAGRRTVAIPPGLKRELEEHKALYSGPGIAGRVFIGLKGGTLRRHVLRNSWNTAKDEVGLPERFTLHDLRHTANTITAAAGASTRELMHRMGHASPDAALRYQHATQDRDAAIATLLGDLVEQSRPLRALRSVSASGKLRGVGAGLAIESDENGHGIDGAVPRLSRENKESGRRESNSRSQLGNRGEPVVSNRWRTTRAGRRVS